MKQSPAKCSEKSSFLFYSKKTKNMSLLFILYRNQYLIYLYNDYVDDDFPKMCGK